MAEVQTPAVSSSKDNALLVFSIVAILGGIAAFYWYTEPALPLRIGMVVLGLAAGAGPLWLRSPRRQVVPVCHGARPRLRTIVRPRPTPALQTPSLGVRLSLSVC